MFKVAMIGAGSVVFVKNLLTDILDLPELREVTISLHDIDAERLETAGMMARWTAEQFGANAKIEEHLDRRAALDGADFVINMVQIGMHEATLVDFQNFVKLAYLSPYIHHSGGTIVEPTDEPVSTRHLDMVFSHIKYSDKAFMGSVTAGANAAARRTTGPRPSRSRPNGRSRG